MKQERRESAKKRLENQLLSGVKNVKEDGKLVEKPLEEADIKRIKKEQDILKDRLAGVKKIKKQKNE